jgi:hypothetical protein
VVEAEIEQPLIIRIPYTIGGTPMGLPTAGLLKNGETVDLEEMKRQGRIEVEVTDDAVIIKMKKPEAGDNGEWEMALTNSAGTEKAQFDLLVKCPPGPPENVECYDITAESCKIRWTRPKNDGGAAIRGYYIERQEGRSGAWTKVGEAKDTNAMVSQTFLSNQFIILCHPF